jgi:hypothetical protein
MLVSISTESLAQCRGDFDSDRDVDNFMRKFGIPLMVAVLFVALSTTGMADGLIEAQGNLRYKDTELLFYLMNACSRATHGFNVGDCVVKNRRRQFSLSPCL